ncbi:2-dehydro-3-deoxygalactonokinase [Sphaerotilus sp.]|uniref:2-dehydro-3-deoxygalactonokinase n=1 Tax=Sphaerotilus sp. TaxID=2093942 RepID=UPI0034E26B1C
MITIDWGTTSLRAYRLGVHGEVLDQRSAAAGLLACGGDFESVLCRQIAGWDDPVILLAGMVGSRSGWHEVPYVQGPAGLSEIAAGLVEVPAASLPGRRVFIAPGLAHRPGGRSPEVMRGEETQVLGLLPNLPGDGPHTVCLPGTHSKWVQVQDGCIVSLRTAMTGELYALLREQSLLAALMPATLASDVDDADAFARGVVASGGSGGLANHLFGVRTQGLFGQLAAAQAPSYLSGLLIGHELRDLLAPSAGAAIHLVGGSALVTRYARALALLGAIGIAHAEALTARGLHRLAQARGLV